MVKIRLGGGGGVKIYNYDMSLGGGGGVAKIHYYDLT